VEAASFLAGVERDCALAQVGETRPLDLTIEFLEPGPHFLTSLVARLGSVLRTNQSTLIFTNTRSLTERLAWRLRQRYPAWVEEIGVHHSALAASRRRRVERALKQGGLRAVVSSSSLELGLDAGTVDGVVLVHPPGGVVRLLQRVGRSGHGPTRPRRGLVLTANPAELLEATVTGASGRSGQYEALRSPGAPLDVLCQQLLGMAAGRAWTRAEAWTLVRRAHRYCDLTRSDFDGCLDYLSGRRRNGEEWLPPRLRWQGDTFSILDDRTARLLRRNLGTILADEQRPVRLNNGSPVGELEDAYAERLQPGDRFLLDGRCLEYRRDEQRTLLVEEVVGWPQAPRWDSEGWLLSAELARRLYGLRVRAAEALRSGPDALADLLRQEYELDDSTALALLAYIQRQDCVSEVPDAATCLIEMVSRQGAVDHYVHTPLNRAANDALARVVVFRLARDQGRAAHSLVANLGLVLALPGGAVTPPEWRQLLSVSGFEDDVAQALADSVALRERFQRVAQTGLMLLRHPLGRRRRVGGRDWGERRLFDQVRSADPDFVLLRQAQREVGAEVCDGAAARSFLEQLPQMAVRCRCLPRISPFVEGWTQVEPGPAEAVETPAEALQRLHAALTGSGPPEFLDPGE
jgi:ATP-dependent Lhr-like helicase